MDEVNKTLFIPLYGKSYVSRKGIIIHDPKAEEIWDIEGFKLKGKSRSKWLAYNMAMRARVFDDWTASMLALHSNAVVLHVGCGLDSRCLRVPHGSSSWFDCDFPDVLEVRRRYYEETESYHMTAVDASSPEQVKRLPSGDAAIVILEGISMYLTEAQMRGFFDALRSLYRELYILMDVYTVFGAKASRFKNPVNDVGVTKLYGTDDVDGLLEGLGLKVVKEHSFTPTELVEELKGAEKLFFKMMFTGRTYRKIYRMYEITYQRDGSQ